jgi:transcriptional regulator with XRE-family HTH domain
MEDTVGTRIAAARADKGWTQNDLAKATFTAQTCISYWEGDKRAITVHDLLLVAAALDVTAASLIPDDAPPPAPPPPLDLTFLTQDLREILYRLEKTVTGPHTVVGWAAKPTQMCTTRPGKHWHLFLYTHGGAGYRIDGLHFNTEPEAVAWGSANLRLRHLPHGNQ